MNNLLQTLSKNDHKEMEVHLTVKAEIVAEIRE